MTPPRSDGDAPVLDMSGVRKEYTVGEQQIVALADATLTIDHDEIVALIGPSGSGKTTLCSIAGGLLTPTDGTVEFAGRDISGLSARELTEFRRTSVGFVFQSVNLVPFLTARENLLVVDELGGRRRGDRAAARRRADELLGELGLGDRAENLPAGLSGGERQRVAIGRALMNQPRLVLFDEPTSALDSTTGDQVVKLIRDELKARETSAIIVTHDQRITHYADRVVRIEDGRVDNEPVSDDTPPEVAGGERA
ncbi:MAG TPA: ABC transporter ATP-binding protein [Ilumatobacter sp.]|nr:ABC transporter ATP-binding protein [Ilumatobacter sp.]